MLRTISRRIRLELQKAARRLKPESPAPPPIAPDAKVEIRTYQPGDEEAILRLFRECFGERDLAHWKWKFQDHPWGREKIAVALADGELIAHYGGYPARWRDCGPGETGVFRGLQVGDTMTSPRARGLGRRRTSLLHGVMQFYFDEFCENGVDLNFGFNTGKIQRYYLRLVPNSRLVEEAPLRVLETSGAAVERLASIAAGGEAATVREVRETSAEWDEFFERQAPNYGFLVERSGRYVNWRYLERPDVDYSVYAARVDGTLVGWSAFRHDGERLVWVDGLFEEDRPEAFAAILSRALGKRRYRAVTTVEGWFTPRPAWWARIAEEAGFEPRPEPNRIGMIYKPFGAEDVGPRMDGRIYYTQGDSDLF